MPASGLEIPAGARPKRSRASIAVGVIGWLARAGLGVIVARLKEAMLATRGATGATIVPPHV